MNLLIIKLKILYTSADKNFYFEASRLFIRDILMLILNIIKC